MKLTVGNDLSPSVDLQQLYSSVEEITIICISAWRSSYKF